MTSTPTKPDNSETPIELDYWPAINAYYHHEFNQSSLTIQVLSGTGAINNNALATSVQAISACHPLLNCQLTEIENRPVLQPIGTTSELEVREVSRLDDLSIAKQLLTEGLGQELWRLVLVKSKSPEDTWVLVMLCHHTIGDGIAMVSFLDQVLKHYSNELPNAPELTEPPALPEKLTVGRNSTTSADETEEWRINEHAAIDDREIGLIRISMTAEESARLIASCKRNRTWLTNLITVALLRANGFNGAARIATAVDIRRRIMPPISPDTFGCYAGVLESTVPWADDIWEHARNCATSQLRSKGTLVMKNFKSMILKLMMQSRIEKALGAGVFASGCCISNMGTIQLQEQYGELQINNSYLASRQLAGLYSIFLTISEFRNELVLNFSFAEPLLSTQQVDELSQQVRSILMACADT